MSAEFFTVAEVKASRKAHRCYWCLQMIEVGQPKVTTSGKFEGDFLFTRFHPECYKALERWQRENPEDDYWPDEGTMKRGDHHERK